MSTDILFARVDDYEAVYIDGNLVLQDHSIDAYKLLRNLQKLGILDCSLDSIEVELDEDASSFPDSLSELTI